MIGTHANSSSIFQKVDILKIKHIIKKQKLLVLLPFLNGTLPESYARLFALHDSVRETRQTFHLQEPLAALTENSFVHAHFLKHGTRSLYKEYQGSKMFHVQKQGSKKWWTDFF